MYDNSADAAFILYSCVSSNVIWWHPNWKLGQVQFGQVTGWIWSHDIRLWFSQNSYQTYSTRTSRFDRNRISSQRCDRLNPAQWTKNILMRKQKDGRTLLSADVHQLCLLRKKEQWDENDLFLFVLTCIIVGVFPHYELHIKWLAILNPLLLYHFPQTVNWVSDLQYLCHIEDN